MRTSTHPTDRDEMRTSTHPTKNPTYRDEMRTSTHPTKNQQRHKDNRSEDTKTIGPRDPTNIEIDDRLETKK